ncbi:MAG: lipopolysaccharide assembly protein LapA domain-containing protein [Beijerinckiaceae bacterium]
MANARKLLKFAVLLPAAAAMILFSIANRAPVTLSLDPFNRETPAISFTLPLYLIVLAAIGVGVLAGGVGAWFAQGRHRKGERTWRREAQTARADAERLRVSLSSQASLPRS